MKKRNLVLGFMLIMLLAMSTGLMATNYLVSGAGSTEMNETFYETGELFNNKPTYLNINGQWLFWAEGQMGMDGWVMYWTRWNGLFLNDYTYYCFNSDTPTNGPWGIGVGMNPPPTVTEDAPVPVNLSSFYALYIGGIPTLYWTTQTETDNAYWNVHRGTTDNFITATNINAVDPIPGNGTTNLPSDYVYVDTTSIVQNTTYWYWIEDVSTDGETEVHEPITLFIPYDETPIIPDTYGLQQNFPNPFNPSTAISFTLVEDSNVELIIYNIKGERIKTIFNDYVYADQINTAIWDGSNDDRKQVSSGVYFYKLITDSTVYWKKMLMVK